MKNALQSIREEVLARSVQIEEAMEDAGIAGLLEKWECYGDFISYCFEEGVVIDLDALAEILPHIHPLAVASVIDGTTRINIPMLPVMSKNGQ